MPNQLVVTILLFERNYDSQVNFTSQLGDCQRRSLQNVKISTQNQLFNFDKDAYTVSVTPAVLAASLL
jgi:hypothetical protein